MGEFRFIDHTADIAVQLSGKDMNDLFQAAHAAWKKIVIDDCLVETSEDIRITLHADSPEELLVSFLEELNYYLTVRRWICGRLDDFDVMETARKWHVQGRLTGEPMREGKHEIQVEIKAVTFHQLSIGRKGDELTTLLVFDI